jgi:hypothetical protein
MVAIQRELIEDHELTRELIPRIIDGEKIIRLFSSKNPHQIAFEEWETINAFKGELGSVKEARLALYIVLRCLSHELISMNEEPEFQERIEEILKYLQENVPAIYEDKSADHEPRA